MKASVCLVTTGQPSTNPRAVKEADALSEAGYEVRLIGAQWADWADAADERLLAGRPWKGEVIRWKRSAAPARFWWTRGRHHAARAALSWPGLKKAALPAAVGRVTPELTARARQIRADLYIAHNLGALPAAAAAARRWGSRLGFDAEDFHSGQFAPGDRSASWRATRDAEARWIPACDYVTAAAPGIAVPVAILDRYVGAYTSAAGFTATFRREGDKLFVKPGANPEVALNARSDTRFQDPRGPIFEFQLDPQGKVTGAVLEQGTQRIPLERK